MTQGEKMKILCRINTNAFIPFLIVFVLLIVACGSGGGGGGDNPPPTADT